MDDREAELMRADVAEALAQGPDAPLVDALAQVFTGEDFQDLTAEIVSRRDALRQIPTRDAVLQSLGLAPGTTAADITGTAFDGSEARLMAAVLPVMAGLSKTYAGPAARFAALDWAAPGGAEFEALAEVFLYKSGATMHGSKAGRWPQSNHSSARQALGPWLDALDALMGRVAAARQIELALAAAERTLVLHRFAAAFLPAYTARKQARGFLDFDDLILKTRDLLTDPAVAAWVLYRLDGGIDHILVDEAQDTSPVQWQVIERLAEEMTSGTGAGEDRRRTIFVVGDRKQSIYSFQGADPAEFDRMREEFGRRLAAGPGLQKLVLPFSFRSSEAVLRAVDHTFGAFAAAEGMIEQKHRAIKTEMPGRVDLWPMIPKAEAAEDHDWFDPVDTVAENHHSVRLARVIAAEIVRMRQEESLPTENGRRPVRAGDVMILVQRRSELFHEIIRACKEAELPVAGADRLKLGGELAVRDLAALLAFLALQEDDLSLATALRSPLFGWSEDALYRLAQGRPGYLWQALRDAREAHPDTLAVLDELRADSDFLRPYDLIDRILTRHDGRRRLLARLGPEAEDGIDALLAQALAYERNEVPSLTGFLTWLETDDVEVKRQLDSAGDRIRVMTVHGAKGLESGIVILPDTATRRVEIRAQLLPGDGGDLVWRVPSGEQPETMKQSLSRLKAAQEAERLRLLYVAMTRAENWLIVCGAGEAGEIGSSWHGLVEQGLKHAGTVDFETPAGAGQRLASGTWDAGDLHSADAQARPAPVLPAWAEACAAPPVKPTAALSPSDLGGEKALFGEIGAPGDLETAMRRGRQIHLLLEHLPGLPRDDWAGFARDLLAIGEDAVAAEEADLLCADAARVLDTAALKPLFSETSLAEVALTASLPELGGARIHGAIDRLLVEEDRVLAVDYKTNRIVPARAEDVPEGLLRQIGAYIAALAQIYPDRRVEGAILWTAEARLMSLPDEMLRDALVRAGTS